MNHALLADENLDSAFAEGFRRRIPDVDVVTVQSVGLRGATGADILNWAAKEGRIVISHDVNTMIAEALYRVRSSDVMPGLIIIHQTRR